VIGCEATKRMMEFGEKVTALILAEQDTPGIAGILIGIGAGMMVGRGSTDAAIYEAVDASIKSARGK